MNFFKKSKVNNVFYSEESTLNKLSRLLETDKGTGNKYDLSWGKDWPELECWGYTTTYEKYMYPFKKENINFLEIGICDKRFPYASPQLWLSYFKNIDLYCIDNFWGQYLTNKHDDIKKLNDWGVNFIYADQGNYCDWNEIKESIPVKFDFIVEDGSHWPNHMVITLWQSIDLIKPGGYYFMEDLQNPVNFKGSMKIDNTLLTENLIKTKETGIFYSNFLNEQQNKDIQDNFELVDLVLDSTEKIYLAVFKKK
jgi:hypothetical protein